ncbi:MAG: phosphodiester glycosidase family protein [Phormidesmis sp.]
MPPDKQTSDKPYSLQNSYLWGLVGLSIGIACLTFWNTTENPALTKKSAQVVTQPVTTASVIAPEIPAEIPTLQYQTYDLPQATVHVVHIPTEISISIAVADELTTVEALAERENALAAINGGFFDPQNGKTTSHLTDQGQSAGNPRDNERLTNNPALQDYLPQVFNRSEFRAYRCQSSDFLHYDITFHDAPPPSGCELESALGAGPQLLPQDTAAIEAFTDYDNNGVLVRDAIGSVQPNARSAIALKADGSVLLLMAAQYIDATTSPGLSLAELTAFAASLGAVKLLNLDGGSSSTLYYDGQVYAGRVDTDSTPLQRPVKSVIVVKQPEP